MEPENTKFICPTPNEINRHVGAQIKRLRRENNLTMADIAETIGVTYQQIQKYERGTNRVPVASLYRLSRCLKVPVTAFYDGLEENAVFKEPGPLISQSNARSTEWDSTAHILGRLHPSVEASVNALITTLTEKHSARPAKPMQVARARKKV